MTCNAALGCTEIPGICDVTNALCDIANPCLGGTCVGYGCTGFVSCQGFGVGDCTGNTAYGCGVTDCSVANGEYEFVATPTFTCSETTSSCKWTCGAPIYDEICSDGIDNDLDGDIDCEDSNCQHGYSWTNAEADSYKCTGTGVYSDTDLAFVGLTHYCADNVAVDPDVGLCCPAGETLDYIFGTWTCIGSQPCRIPEGLCSSDYGPNPLFIAWALDNNCLNQGAPSACCSVIKFGELNYWSDTGNVKIY